MAVRFYGKENKMLLNYYDIGVCDVFWRSD
jgi:hypothetical protein